MIPDDVARHLPSSWPTPASIVVDAETAEEIERSASEQVVATM